MISMEIMKLLFTLEPLMTDLISFIYNNVDAIFLYLEYYTLKCNKLSKNK